MLRASVAALAVVLVAAPASAQWLHGSTGGAFDGKPLHTALIAEGDYAFGLRCTAFYDLEIVYLTPERLGDLDAVGLNRMSPFLLVRIDDLEPTSYSATIHVYDGRAGFTADSDEVFAGAVAAASRRVAVAARLSGKIFHEEEFRVDASNAAIDALLSGCGF